MLSYGTFYPLTHPQKSIWYLDKFHPNNTFGNVAASVFLEGKVDLSALEKAINIFIKQNDAIRLRVFEDGEEPKQYVSEYRELHFDKFDFTYENGSKDYEAWVDKHTSIPFQTIEADLFYFALVKLNDRQSGFYFNLHHLTCDAWAMTLGAYQILDNYWKYINNLPVEQDSKPSYIDYILAEQQYKNSEKFLAHKSFWESKFETVPEFTALTTRSINSSTRANRKTFLLSSELTSEISHYCKDFGASAFNLFFAVFSVYLNRVTSKEDLVIGTPVLNRINYKQKNTLGMFISTTPVRTHVNNNLEFQDYLTGICKEWKQLLRYQQYPFELVLRSYRQKHKVADNLIDVLFSYQNAKLSFDKLKFTTKWHFSRAATDSLAIHLSDREDEGKMLLEYDYLAEQFSEEEIERMHAHLLNLLRDAIKHPSKRLCQLQMLTERERSLVLDYFNQTDSQALAEMTIQRLFEAQAEKTPANAAVVFQDNLLTYQELNLRANQLALLLRNKGVKPGSLVPILFERSLEMIIAIFAILKAGGAYLPLDPESPCERLEHIVEDSGCEILLTTNTLKDRFAFCGEIIDLATIVYSNSEVCLNNLNKPSDLAYAIYTSGSSGQAKGVLIEHHSVVNLSNWFGHSYDLEHNKNVAQMTTYTFDVSVEEIIVSLLNGATVFIPDKETIFNKRDFTQFLRDNKINLAQFVPTTLRELLADSPKVPSLNVVICGGETLDEALKNRILGLGYNLYNHYGPTETTVDALVSKCSSDKVNLGKPIANTKCFILDKYLNPQPIGIPGELFLTGEGLARGYIKDAQLTARKFIASPFVSGSRMYRTGDLAKWLPDGSIEFLGRMDSQIKLRGYRIELEEIRNQLSQIDGVGDCVVVDRLDRNGNKYLAAYITAKNRLHLENQESVINIVTVAERPSLRYQMESLHNEAWPAFFQGDLVLRTYWRQVYERFDDYQIGLFLENRLVAVGNTIPIFWNSEPGDLPEGWDEALLRGCEQQKAGIKPNTLCVLTGVVNPDEKGQGLSYRIIEAFKLLANAQGLKHLIIPVRPTQKEDFSDLDLKEYSLLRKEDGTSYDYWLRVHEKLGGKIVRYSPKSQRVIGTIQNWEAWTGLTFDKSGSYKVRGAMQSVNMDLEQNIGVYYDQAIWIQHDVNHSKQDLTVSRIRQHLREKLPSYMVPGRYHFIDALPVFPNGKVDIKSLPDTDMSHSHKSYESPNNDIEQALVKAWSEVLDCGEIGIGDNFFELGGDSLAIIEVLTALLEFDWNLKAQDFYEYPTVKELAMKIMGGDAVRKDPNGMRPTKLCHPKRVLPKADFRGLLTIAEGAIAEVAVASEFQPVDIIGLRHNINAVLITGATGFLGIHLLAESLSDSNATAYCLVRGENSEDRLRQALEYYFPKLYSGLIGERIFIVNGDISLPRFGLTANQYEYLGDQIDTVIHAAAVVKHYGDYSEFERVNVLGTQEVISFCKTFHCVLGHISTSSVSGNYFIDQRQNLVFTENDLYVGQNYSENVYVRSKFEAENFVYESAESGLIPVVFRVGMLMGRYSDGHFQKNINDNAMYNRLRSIVELGAVPANISSLCVEFTPVDYCARAIIKILRTGAAKGRAFHIFNQNTVFMEDLIRMLGSLGINIKLVSDCDFRQVVEHLSRDKERQKLIAGLVNDLTPDKTLDFLTSVKIDSELTLEYLKQLGFEWPKIQSDYLAKVLDYMQMTGFLRKIS